MKIGIIGYGWLAEQIGEVLKHQHRIFGISRNPEKVERLTQKGIEMSLWKAEGWSLEQTKTFMNCDALIVSLPVSKKSFDEVTAENVMHYLHAYQKKVIIFSSTGVYPDKRKVFTEKHTEDLQPHIAAYETFFRTRLPQSIVLRLGGLMGANRKFTRFFKERAIPNATDAVNHIHCLDIASAIARILESQPKENIYNMVAPQHPSKMEVFLRQTNQIVPKDLFVKTPSRIISSDAFVEEFSFTFQYPNPAEF